MNKVKIFESFSDREAIEILEEKINEIVAIINYGECDI